MKVKLCNRCKKPISLARKAELTSRWTVLDAAPVKPESVMDATSIRVVDRGNAYRLPHIREALMLRREIPMGDAHFMAAEDFPWHTIHYCESDDD